MYEVKRFKCPPVKPEEKVAEEKEKPIKQNEATSRELYTLDLDDGYFDF